LFSPSPIRWERGRGEETAEAKAQRIVSEELGRPGWNQTDLASRRKSDPLKLHITARLRRETTLSIKQIAERLQLGTTRSASLRLHTAMRQPIPVNAAQGHLGMRPSSSLPAGKYVVLAGEAVGGFFARWFAPILRNKSGRSARLGDVLVLTSKPCGGLMAGVLPESPRTPEVPDFAKSVLKASGVRLIRAATSARPDTGQDSNPPN
jgi:hypothetical protein